MFRSKKKAGRYASLQSRRQFWIETLDERQKSTSYGYVHQIGASCLNSSGYCRQMSTSIDRWTLFVCSTNARLKIYITKLHSTCHMIKSHCVLLSLLLLQCLQVLTSCVFLSMLWGVVLSCVRRAGPNLVYAVCTLLRQRIRMQN